MTRRWIPAAAALAAVLMALTGCASADAVGPAGRSSTGGSSAPAGLNGELTVYAAASLTGVFGDLLDEFGERHPGVTIAPASFGGSSTLATQIVGGAPADVFASANTAVMKTVVDAGLVAAGPTTFTSNTLEIAVRPGNPKHITGLADLGDKGVLVALCAPQVPCGSASHELLDADGISVTPATEELNVKSVLAKVRLGEVDAGLVYRTDVASADGEVEGVTIPDADKAVNDYPIAVLKRTEDPAVARAFMGFVLSDAGQSVLARYGFGAP